MTAQPTRDQLRAHLHHLIAAWDGPGNPSISVADLTHLHALLGQLDQAEARIAEEKRLRMKATAAATRADARIKAVRDVLDNPIHLADWDDPLVPATHVRRALDGDA